MNVLLQVLISTSVQTGYEVYDTCREYGAIIATGHEHSYSRTYAMKNFSSQQIASTTNDVVLKEGGNFFVLDLNSFEDNPLHSSLDWLELKLDHGRITWKRIHGGQLRHRLQMESTTVLFVAYSISMDRPIKHTVPLRFYSFVTWLANKACRTSKEQCGMILT